MPVQFENYSHSFLINGKPVFAPSDLGRRIGEDVKQRVEDARSFPDYYYHLRAGGHVAALHSHRPYAWFCKVDIQNFFYSVARNRIVRALRDIGVPRYRHYAKWSSVKNPYTVPSYVLPYGFVQSPILATLVLDLSEIGNAIRRMPSSVNAAVYMDDISLSSENEALLRCSYDDLLEAINTAGFVASASKSVAPCKGMTIFNCLLRNDETLVTPERIAEFFRLSGRSQASIDGFERYRSSVEVGNV